jgi:hypothetical protein
MELEVESLTSAPLPLRGTIQTGYPSSVLVECGRPRGKGTTMRGRGLSAWMIAVGVLGALLTIVPGRAQTGPQPKVIPPPSTTELLRRNFPNGLPDSPPQPAPPEDAFFWIYQNGNYSTTLKDCVKCSVPQSVNSGQLIFVTAYRLGVFKTMGLHVSIHGTCSINHNGSIYTASQSRSLQSSLSHNFVTYDPVRHQFALFENTVYLVDPGTDVQQARGSVCSAYIFADGHEVQATGEFVPYNILATVDVVTVSGSSLSGFLSVPMT